MIHSVEMEKRTPITLLIRWDEEASVFVGKCLEYNVYSQGRTLDEAALATVGAVRLLLQHIKNQGEKP